jgi:hypothetical protein
MDFLLFDQDSEKLAFPRFEECMGLLTQSRKYSLKNIFLEICGKNHKYITFRRLVQSYLEYKSNSKNRSAEFKDFFAFIFKTLLKVN